MDELAVFQIPYLLYLLIVPLLRGKHLCHQLHSFFHLHLLPKSFTS